MTTPAPIRIEAEVDPCEHPAMLAGAQQLAQALNAATGADWPIQLRYWERGAAPATSQPGSVIVLSLLADVDRDEPFVETEARWRARLAQLAKGAAPVLICTVFRALADRRAPGGLQRVERIRRLDRMAADLSHDLGATVVDIDRAFAHIGGRVLKTDYRLSGRLAAEVAGHALVLCILSLALDEVVSAEVQDQARTFQGGLREINTLVSRRLAAG
ncbi:MAG TPA: hypothetical protein VGL73_09105 [Caulobacteraceae bacterium]|jgi:hypothetical protein